MTFFCSAFAVFWLLAFVLVFVCLCVLCLCVVCLCVCEFVCLCVCVCFCLPLYSFKLIARGLAYLLVMNRPSDITFHSLRNPDQGKQNNHQKVLTGMSIMDVLELIKADEIMAFTHRQVHTFLTVSKGSQQCILATEPD